LAVNGSLTFVQPAHPSAAVKLAMLPLGAETGRHIRNNAEGRTSSDAVKHQEPNPVAEVAEHRSATYAMLPLGTETGRHIRDISEENKEPVRSVAATAPQKTA
jgi:hypothetical protein